MGFITCLSEQPRRWSAAEIELVESIAEPLEIAIRQAQLYEQSQQQATRERLITRIINQTRQSFDTETILTEAIAQLLEALQVDRCLVHLVEDPNTSEVGEESRGRREAAGARGDEGAGKEYFSSTPGASHASPASPVPLRRLLLRVTLSDGNISMKFTARLFPLQLMTLTQRER